MTGITKIGKYIIRRELGKGAMGVVYEGFDPVIERTVAIKTILPQQLNSAEAKDVMARFKREAQSAGRLNHPGVVAVYDYGEVVPEDDHTMVATPSNVADASRSIAFIAMEFVKGRELRDFFEANERFPLHEVERIMGEILAALGHAHSQGVVHRDIKPANLIVLDDRRIKIADFGIARIEKSELTQAGTVMGTPSYMSPEQFMGQTVDGRSDIFSCGVILYQFLTGEKPFTGNTTTIMYKVLREEPLAPSMLNVAVPAAFDAVVKKAMAKSPDERYQNAAEFAAAISAAVRAPASAATADADATVVSAVRPPAAAAPAVPAAVGAQAAPSPAPRPSAAQPAPAAPASAPAAVHAPSAVPASNASKPRQSLVLAGVAAAVVIAAAAGGLVYMQGGKTGASGDTGAVAGAAATGGPANAPAPATAAAAPAAPTAATQEPALEEGTVVISALGLVDPADPRFKGDVAAAQAGAREDAKRQLVEKVLGLYIENASLQKNYAVLDQKLLSQSGSFIKTVLQEGAPVTGKDGLLETETRAVVKIREVQKSLNQLSRDERIAFIRNNGDPRVAIHMTIGDADSAQALPPTRSQLAENVLKERIKSFGFRVWANDGDTKTGPEAKQADFQVMGEAKLKLLSMKLPASGLTVTKSALTSWTVKAIDKATGEEIYLNTVTPQGKSWANEDQALAEIGQLMGSEFSRDFFLQHFNFGVRRTMLQVSGLPDGGTARLLLRELRSVREVLDARLVSESGQFQLQLPEGNPSDLVQNSIVRPLNAKLGQNCLALAGSSEGQVNLSYAPACAETSVRARMESLPPAGLIDAAPERAKPLQKGLPPKTVA
jgi:hypothetical protein